VIVGFTSSCAVGPNSPPVGREDDRESEGDSSYETPHSDLSKWRNRPDVGSGHEGDPESPVGTGSSLFNSVLEGEEYTHIRMDSPPPLDETLENIRDERRYRMLLQHEFHPSCAFILSSYDANTLTS